MKHFLIKYYRRNASPEDWHRDIAEFVSALDTDPDLMGRISYRVLKSAAGPDYYHIATVIDTETINILQRKEFFKRYTEKTSLVAGEDVKGAPIEIVCETKHRM